MLLAGLVLCSALAGIGLTRLDPRVDLSALVAAQAGLAEAPPRYALAVVRGPSGDAASAWLKKRGEVAAVVGAPRSGPRGDTILGIQLTERASAQALEEDLAASFEQANLVGLHTLERAMTRVNRRAQVQHFSAIAGAFLLLLGVLLRRPAGVALALAAPALGCVWLAGIAGATGLPLSGPNVLVLPIVLVLGLADTVHLLRRVEEERLVARAGALHRALDAVVAPCFWTSLTTAIGFLGLMASGSPVLSRFGALVAGGVAIAWIVGLLLPSLALRRWPDLAVARPPGTASTGPLRARPALFLLAVLTLLGAMGATQVVADLRLGPDLPEDDPVWQTLADVDARADGLFPLLITLHADRPEHRSRLLPASEELSRTLSRLPVVGNVSGLLDAAELDPAVRERLGNAPTDDPVTRRARHKLLDMAAERSDLVTRSTVPVVASLHVGTGRQWAATIRQLERSVDPPIRVAVRGHPQLVATAVTRLWPDLGRILGTTMGLTLLALLLLARSGATALLALPSLGITTLATLGLLGWLAMPLSPPNLFVLSACTGVGVDAVIHLATRAREAMVNGQDAASAVRTSLATAGVPVLWTYAILLCGLGVLLGSPMPAVQDAATAFGGAMALDLVVTWATFHAFGPWVLSRTVQD